MTLRDRLKACDGTLMGFLQAALPGTSRGMRALRHDVEDLCADPLATGALLLGPSGSGKSSLARIIALGRYVQLLHPDGARDFLSTVTTEGPGRISARWLSWFVEQSLPGLEGDLAHSQLFGHEKGAYTGADRAKIGVFERASGGLEGAGSRGTFGVVFLDEIGDLPLALQPKLLAALSGAEVPRLGGEGREGFRFEGLVLGATWRDVHDDRVLRRDLRDRMSDHIITLPSLRERTDELRQLAEHTIEDLKESHAERFRKITAEQVKHLDRSRLQASLHLAQKFSLSAEDIVALEAHDWASAGELRGLVQALKRTLLSARPLAEVLRAQLASEPTELTRETLAGSLLEAALATAPAKGTTVAAHFNTVMNGARTAVRDMLREPGHEQRFAAHLGIEPILLRRQLNDMARRDSTASGREIAAPSDVVPRRPR